jgi:hypothetical protein
VRFVACIVTFVAASPHAAPWSIRPNQRLQASLSAAPRSFTMLFHVSIEADDPRRLAEVIAELWGGAAAQFPSVTDGSWVALSGDERGTIVEIYPRGTELHEVPGDNDATGMRGAERRHNATHFAMATRLSEAEVFSIAAREGWPAKYRKRGGVFGVIEIFAEGCQMIEVLTDEMQREYVAAITIPNWMAMLAAQRQQAMAA